MIEERRDWATRPHDIYRCESCGYWEPRRERAVNTIPTCPYCRVGRYYPARYARLWPAVRKEPVV